MLRLVYLFILLFPFQLVLAQDPYPILTKKLGKCDGDACTKKIEYFVKKEISQHKQQQLAIQNWSFYIYDSLSLDVQADSICTLLLQSKSHDKLKSAHRLHLFKGNQSMDSSQFEDAIKHFYKALKLTQAPKLKNEEGKVQRLIGLAYLKLENHKIAENHLRVSLKIHEAENDELGIANACISLGNALKDQGKTKASIIYYNRSLELAKKLDNNRLIAGNYNNLGNAYRRLKKHKEAVNYFLKALEINKKTDNQLWISFNYHNLGMTYTDLKQFDKAIQYHLLSNDLKKKLGDSLSMVSGYEGISNAYAGKQDFQNAYRYLKLHIRLKDTMNLIEQANALSDLETRYETEKKETQIAQLQTENELRMIRNSKLQEDAAKTRNYFLLAGLAVIFLMIGLFFVLRSNRMRRKTNELLNDKNEEILASHDALKSAMDELSVKNKEIIDSINYATYIQQASLPKITQRVNNELKFELFFAPKDIVSGDFYFSYEKHQRSIFGVGDCTGHGVPGAMVSLIGMNALDKVIREEDHELASAMVESFNEHVLSSLHRGGNTINDGMDLSLCIFNHSNNLLQFTGANHNALVIRSKKQSAFDSSFEVKIENEDFQIVSLPGARRPIGKTLSKEAFFENEITLLKHDRLVLFSDGYADQTGGEIKKKMKRANMMNLLLVSSTYSINEQMNYMKEAFSKWKSTIEQVDDVCVLIVEVVE